MYFVEIISGKLKGPTAFQIEALRTFQNGNNGILCEIPRNGKSTAIALGLLQIINVQSKHDYIYGNITPNDDNSELNQIQAIYLSPEHESAIETRRIIIKWAQKLHVIAINVIGGIDFNSNVRALKNSGINIICSCPGRLAHLIRKEKINLEYVKILVIEDFDIIEKENNDFDKDMITIYSALPITISAITISSTVSTKSVDRTRNNFSKIDDVKTVNDKSMFIKFREYMPCYIKQFYILCRGEVDKLQKFIDLLYKLNPTKHKIIVYVNSNENVEKIYQKLGEIGTFELPKKFRFGAKLLNQQNRMQTLKEIKESKYSITISTDLLSRHSICKFDICIQLELPSFDYDIEEKKNIFVQRVARLRINNHKNKNNQQIKPKYHYCFVESMVNRETGDQYLMRQVSENYEISLQQYNPRVVIHPPQ